MKRLEFEEYINGIKAGDINVLGRAITLIESTNPHDIDLGAQILDGLLPQTGKSVRIGITGAPGVGKSTFISQFGQVVVENNRRLAVLAIDPTSSRSGGSIMGDKTRMTELLQVPEVFVRPSPAGESLGGVARKTREAMMLCEAAGFDYIMIETVGTGQSEIAVKSMVDYLLLLLPPLGGDELQGIKKGVVELADGIAITKCDGRNKEAAQTAAREYKSALGILGKSSDTMVEISSAIEKTGLPEIYAGIEQHLELARQKGVFELNRKEQLVNWLHAELRFQLVNTFYSALDSKKRIAEMEQRIQEKEVSPQMAVRELLRNYPGR